MSAIQVLPWAFFSFLPSTQHNGLHAYDPNRNNEQYLWIFYVSQPALIHEQPAESVDYTLWYSIAIKIPHIPEITIKKPLEYSSPMAAY